MCISVMFTVRVLQDQRKALAILLFLCMFHRKQEEESLKVAIALSEAEVKEPEKEEEGEVDGGDLLLDLNTSGLADPWATKIPEAPPSYDDVTTGLSDPWSTFPTPATGWCSN